MEKTNKVEMGKKTCSKCGVEKDVSLFYRSSKSKDGRTSSCKECQREPYRIFHKNKKSKEATKILNDGCKTCVKCNKSKVLSEFKKYIRSCDGYYCECDNSLTIIP